MLKYLAVFLIPMVYFLILWLVPWQEMYSIGSLPSSILFDIIFIILGLFIFKMKIFVTKLKPKVFMAQGLVVIVLAIFCIFLSNLMKLNSPFKYLDLIFLKLLIIAPIVEELVFRGVFIEVGEKVKLNRRVSALLNAFLFSLSHAPALWFLEKEFHSFIVFQLIYTLALGYICALSRFKSKGIVAPITLHFLFNLVFYFAINTKYL